MVLQKTLESPLYSKEFKPVDPKRNQTWTFVGRTDAEAEAPILWPPVGRADSLEKASLLGKMRSGREGDDRGWDGCMASLTPWTWVWANSGRYWWTGRPDVLQSVGWQRVGHDLATKQQQQQEVKKPGLWTLCKYAVRCYSWCPCGCDAVVPTAGLWLAATWKYRLLEVYLGICILQGSLGNT